jgi:GT2 family glycosyltransferase
MSPFRTPAETRQFGAPVVGLFRTALGRDPGPGELADLVPMVRNAVPLTTLAQSVVASEEFRRRYGTLSWEELTSALLRNAFGREPPESAGAALAETEAELVGTIATLALGRGSIPLLPGLAPGAAPDDTTAYQLWLREYDAPDAADLAAVPPIAGPRVSLLMTAGDTEIEGLSSTLDSLRAQTYGDWELLVIAHARSPWAQETLAGLSAEGRLRLDAGPSLQEALAAAAGGLVCLLNAGDELAPTALHEVVAEFAAHPETALLFTDEDTIATGQREAPRFKPAFSPETPLIGQLAVYRSELLRGVPLPFSAADLALQAGPGRVRHLAAVLYHGARLPPALDLIQPEAGGNGGAPVSVIVLTKDRADLLATCAGGVLERTEHSAFELLIVDNGSTEPDALALLAELDGKPRVRVLRQPGPFNFAALNNAAVRETSAELLLLLNNDTEVLDGGWLREMERHALRPDVGVVGARLLYPDGAIQHAGILLGPDGAATHVGRHAAPDDPGYLGQLALRRDLSAVTGACLAIRRAVWDEVGGMDERLAVTWNDVDLCLKVRQAGLRVLWTPGATLIHHESASRGIESEDETRMARFRAEQALMREKWGDALEHDPFLNPNLLATEAGPFALTRPRRPRPWQARLHPPGNHAMRTA